MIEPTTFEQIREERRGDLYPRHLLVGCQNALVLFAAGFYGANDAYWIAEAGLEAICVDIDAEKLAVMKELYPRNWRFVQNDYLGYLNTLPTQFRYDVVSVDCPSSLIPHCATVDLPLLLAVTRKVLTVTTRPEFVPGIIERAKGFDVTTTRMRSATVCWAVLTRI